MNDSCYITTFSELFLNSQSEVHYYYISLHVQRTFCFRWAFLFLNRTPPKFEKKSLHPKDCMMVIVEVYSYKHKQKFYVTQVTSVRINFASTIYQYRPQHFSRISLWKLNIFFYQPHLIKHYFYLFVNSCHHS